MTLDDVAERLLDAVLDKNRVEYVKATISYAQRLKIYSARKRGERLEDICERFKCHRKTVWAICVEMSQKEQDKERNK